MYIALAVIFGVLLRRTRMGLGLGSVVFVPLVFLALVAAWFLPIDPARLPVWIGGNVKYTWSLLLLVYCFVAAVTPVWILLQPRVYLSSFLLFACLVFGGLGMLLASVTGRALATYPAFVAWRDPALGLIFPALFITVACGAVSGFHPIVASGTTAKQCPTERTARPIAYGGMLTEGALAVVALACVMVSGSRPLTPPTVTFAGGIGTFLAVFGLPTSVGATFGLLAVSTFLLTTLDTCTRLTRYIVEEFFDLKGRQWRYATTLLSLAPLGFFAFKQYPNPATPDVVQPAWQVIWPAFGTTNQLLAGLALLVFVVWRRSQGRACWFALWPMLFMLATTTTSMIQLITMNLGEHGTPAIAWINIVMLAMTALIVADTLLHWSRLGTRGPAIGVAINS